MSSQLQNLLNAQTYAFKNKPAIGGFPFLAEVLRSAGVTKNSWTLPACQSLYFINGEAIVSQGQPLLSGHADVPAFNADKLIQAIRADQSGLTTFPEFLLAAWNAGVVRYDVDFLNRNVKYYGVRDEVYEETYSAVELI